jgi:exosortase A-associated hydrolase 2
VTETPFYFRNGLHGLFGVLHSPASTSTGEVFVFCHPFGEEKLWTHRVFVAFARRLAAAGHTVLRFDYMGNGDSDGDFADMSLSTALSDVRCAIDQAKALTGVEAVNLVGLRLGATIASLVAETAPDIHRIVLWAPVVDGARYMQELLRINLTTQMAIYKEIVHDRETLVRLLERGETVNVDGYEIALPLYSEVASVNLSAARKQHLGGCLIAHVDRQERPSAELQQLAASYQASTLTFAQEEPFWKEITRWYRGAPNLFAVTETWLRAIA